jgi:hypothetical protein
MIDNVYCPDPSREEWAMLCGAAEHLVSEAWRTGHARSTFHRFFLEARRSPREQRARGAVDLVLGFEGRELFRTTLTLRQESET